MSDQDTPPPPPPKGDEQKAEKYLKQLSSLIDTNKLKVHHTDLSKFDPTNLYDHYRMDLKDYQVEVSHSKQANTGVDSYIMLFTNLKNIQEGCTEKIILAYISITADQFRRFKTVADEQLDRIKKAEEEKRFNEAMTPIDQTLEQVFQNHDIDPQLASVFNEPIKDSPEYLEKPQKTDNLPKEEVLTDNHSYDQDDYSSAGLRTDQTNY
jgi:hypothetical protein